MTKGNFAVLATMLLSLTSIAAAFAEDQRYIIIRNTDSVWVPGGICALQFRLGNGGGAQGFNKLAVTMRVKDKQGNILEEGVMDVEPFGDSDATRSQHAFLETSCNDEASSIEIVNATEETDGKEINLPLSTFDPQYYQPLAVSITK